MPPVSEPGPAEPTVTGFLDALAKSRLIPSSEVQSHVSSAPASVQERAASLADHFVRARLLTRFQADKLLRGFWQGLSVRGYHLLFPIGRGGMGIVYLARDTSADRLVALKVLPPTRAKSEPRMLARFRREIEIGLALPPNPHLARTHDAGEADGVHFLAMEYVPGRTVRETVNVSGPLSVGVACRVFADVALGLDVAHRAGFVHRDLKPANVIISGPGRGKLLDFGFAYRVGEPAPADPAILGGPGHTIGTMDYLAPEQARNASGVGPSADIYSLGCSLYFAVTGTVPFPGGTKKDKLRWHQTAHPDPVTHHDPTIPAEFDRLILSLMGKRPKDRPTTAADVATLLEAWADPVADSSPASEPTAEELIRTVEARWRALQVGLPEMDEEPAIALESSASEALPVARRVSELDEGDPIADPVYVLPVSRPALFVCGILCLCLAFLLGVIVATMR